MFNYAASTRPPCQKRRFGSAHYRVARKRGSARRQSQVFPLIESLSKTFYCKSGDTPKLNASNRNGRVCLQTVRVAYTRYFRVSPQYSSSHAARSFGDFVIVSRPSAVGRDEDATLFVKSCFTLLLCKADKMMMFNYAASTRPPCQKRRFGSAHYRVARKRGSARRQSQVFPLIESLSKTFYCKSTD